MTDRRILVVGAGPAGLSAAITLADAGHPVVLADQVPGLGGAVYATLRAAPDSAPRHLPEADRLLARFEARRTRIDLRLSTALAGLDYLGNALLTGADGLLFRPRAVILATGARERVQPRPGWTLPGVTTAGAVQISLKTSGRVPGGRLVLAGSGALLYAIGAQLAHAGNPPVAVIEAGQPFAHPGAALGLPLRVLAEAAGYMARLAVAGVPILTGTEVRAIEASGAGLSVTTSRRGRWHKIPVAQVALHDGLAPNDYGHEETGGVMVVQAGDCRAVLGRWAAEADGERAARAVLATLAGGVAPVPDRRFDRFARTQARLAGLFAHDRACALAALPEDTVICRCENRTLADLRAAQEAGGATARITRLSGRFGMGACQGRLCLDWAARLSQPPIAADALRGARWPLRPVLVADLLAAPDFSAEPQNSRKETNDNSTAVADPDPFCRQDRRPQSL